MPPKKTNVKAEQKAKQKIVEDKTFGLKNKNKSAKVNRYVQQLQQQASQGGKAQRDAEEKKRDQAAKKKAEADRQAELAELFKPIAVQKVPFGVDPKTILCQYFKQGACTKGHKCKFSHDLNVGRKDQKIDLYTDNRTKKDEEMEKDTMDSWDQEKLESVIAKKHQSDNSNKPTEIVCKYFVDAIESRKYGWFWICPNGGDKCKYRHALPPGFVLKKKETDEERRLREEDEKENQITIEEFLETERHKLGPNLTPVTYESFMKWKQDRKSRQLAEEEAQIAKKAEAYKLLKAGGKSGMSFSGRELFDFNPEWATGGDAEEGAMDAYERQESDQEADVPETIAEEVQEANVSIDEELFDDLEGLDVDDDDD